MKKIIGLVFLSLTLITPIGAQTYPTQINVIKRYVHDLGQADARDIVKLFTADGFVLSTSAGKKDARVFFNTFLPKIKTAHTQLEKIFMSHEQNSRNHYAARFHFTYTLKNGERGDGEYVDEFIFNPNGALSAVYMFENLKWVSMAA
jgi:hypothetical protein